LYEKTLASRADGSSQGVFEERGRQLKEGMSEYGRELNGRGTGALETDRCRQAPAKKGNRTSAICPTSRRKGPKGLGGGKRKRRRTETKDTDPSPAPGSRSTLEPGKKPTRPLNLMTSQKKKEVAADFDKAEVRGGNSRRESRHAA